MHIPEAESSTIDELRSRFEDYSAHVESVRPHIANEKGVRKGLINPFLQRIGWPMASLSRVAEEFEVPDSGFADYALLDKSGEAIIIIESKSIDVKIDKALPPDQLKRYVHKLANCNVCAWTNGLEWQWFCLDYTNTLSGIAFVTFDVSKADWASPRVLRWLASVKEQFDNPGPLRLLRVARRYVFIERLHSWLSTVSVRPTDDLARFLWKELGIKKNRPNSADLEVMKSAWSVLQVKALCEPDSRPDPVIVDSETTMWNTLELGIEGDLVLHHKRRKRAWRIWDQKAKKWGKWKVEPNASTLLARVTEWLINWGGGLSALPSGISGLLADQPTRKRAASDYYPIFSGKMYVFKNLSNKSKKEWVEGLAAKMHDENGRSAKLGKDFEVWLPTGAKQKTTGSQS